MLCFAVVLSCAVCCAVQNAILPLSTEGYKMQEMANSAWQPEKDFGHIL